MLRPGGRLLFVEHVRSEDSGLARWQDRLEKPWRFFADGCHCNRDTVATIEASPLPSRSVERGELPKAPPLVRPLRAGERDPPAELRPGLGSRAIQRTIMVVMSTRRHETPRRP